MAARVDNASRNTPAEHVRQLPDVRHDHDEPADQVEPDLQRRQLLRARPIDFTPPMITSHVSTAIASPAQSLGTPNWLLITSAIEFGWVNGVVVSAATPRDESVDPRERRRTETVAQVVHRTRRDAGAVRDAELQAERRLAELDRGGKEPYAQIQNSAPGPPDTIAVATPAMFPMPIDAASAVMKAGTA